MAAIKRIKTQYPGVFFIESVMSDGRPEKIFYIRYKRHGKTIEEKAGRQFSEDMTAAKANGIRSDRIRGLEQTNTEKRTAEAEKKAAEAGRYTIGRLWAEYSQGRKPGASLTTDMCRYKKFLEPHLADKEPQEILKLDVDRIRIRLLKTKSPQTVKHVLNLLTWIINYGVKNGLCPGLSFHVEKPEVDNLKTEDLTPEQIQRLLSVIDEDPACTVGQMMKLALYSGMRRGEMLKLKWDDVDFRTGFITLRSPKGGKSQKIPMNNMARELLDSLPQTSGQVFPGKDGGQRSTSGAIAKRIRDKAGLPKDFRPFHGLRHTYASLLASSGQVDIYTLQKLLTHKTPAMTQRYAHLRDEVLKAASGQVDEIFRRQETTPHLKVVGE